MALTATGPLGTLTFISVDPVDPDGTGEAWLRVRYSLDTTGATEALVGFYIWHDDEAGSTLPVWVNAADAVLAGGGDAGDPAVYEVLVSVPLSGGLVTWWETFKEYPLGAAGTLDKGGVIWSGPAVIGENYIGTIAREDFEIYAEGAVPADTGELDAGFGWDGPAVIGSFS